MSQPAGRSVVAARHIGLVGIILIAANGMIGTGIFALPGKLDQAVGAFAPLLLLGAGLGMACIALSFGDCARHFDRSGGPLLYVGTAFGPLPGFVIGWLAYVARVASIAANATVLATTAAVFFPFAATAFGRSALIVAVFTTLITLNIVGVRRALAFLGGITVLKVAPLLVLAVAALGTYGVGAAPQIPTLSAVESIALVALYAFTAFETATVPAAETRDPQRAIPIALVGTVLAITLLYVLVQWAYSASGHGASETPLVDLASTLGGPIAAATIAITVIVSIVGNQASAILANSRITVAMAEQRMLPGVFAAIAPRFWNADRVDPVLRPLGDAVGAKRHVRLPRRNQCARSPVRLSRLHRRGARARPPVRHPQALAAARARPDRRRRLVPVGDDPNQARRMAEPRPARDGRRDSLSGRAKEDTMADIIATTDRLTLRDWLPADRATFMHHLNSPAVMRWLGGVQDDATYTSAFDRLDGYTRDYGHTFWIVERTADGELLGFCGLKRVNSVGAKNPGDMEVGWRFREDSWGQGFAKEAAIASLDLAFGRFAAPHVVAFTVAGNKGSWGLMERIGMSRRPDLDYEDPRFGPDLNPTITYAIDAADWPAARARALA